MSARKVFTKKDLSKVLSAYKKGATLRELAAGHDCSVTTMRQTLLDNGVTMRPRGKVATAKPKAKSVKAKADVKIKAPTAKKAKAKPAAKKGKSNKK